MTMKPKATRFRINRQAAPAATPDAPFAPPPETAGPETVRAAPAPDPSPATAAAPSAATEPGSVRLGQPALTGRQLRLARRVAQKHGLPATSDLDAVRLLREAGIDPFERAGLLELVSVDEAAVANSASRALSILPAGKNLPKTFEPAELPSPQKRTETNHAADILRIQQDIARRRRRQTIGLSLRLAFFVLLPTMLAAWYYYTIATPLYATNSEMVIQQADGTLTAGSSGGMGGMFGGALEANKDSVAVQGYLQSRDAMNRLDADHGFRTHFSNPAIDPIQRVSPDASNEAIYKLYQRNVRISYDPTEGLIKMEVLATDPATSVRFSKALISYAEEQIDHLTRRKRDDQMHDARASYENAETNMLAAQRKVVDLQQRYQVVSSEAEVTLVTQQIGALETQLTQERLSLEQMKANAEPNLARMEPVERRIATLERQIGDLRSRMTQTTPDGMSLAEVQSELLMAQADVQTRRLMLATTLQQMETARIEANRQVRYLSLSVSPAAPDEPAYPRAFENTLVTMVIFAGLYLIISMTAAILREQVTA